MSKSHPQQSSIEYPVKSELIMEFLTSKGFLSIGFDLLHQNGLHSDTPYLLIINGREVKNSQITNPIKVERNTLFTENQVISKLKEANLSITSFEEYISSL